MQIATALLFNFKLDRFVDQSKAKNLSQPQVQVCILFCRRHEWDTPLLQLLCARVLIDPIISQQNWTCMKLQQAKLEVY